MCSLDLGVHGGFIESVDIPVEDCFAVFRSQNRLSVLILVWVERTNILSAPRGL